MGKRRQRGGKANTKAETVNQAETNIEETTSPRIKEPKLTTEDTAAEKVNEDITQADKTNEVETDDENLDTQDDSTKKVEEIDIYEEVDKEFLKNELKTAKHLNKAMLLMVFAMAVVLSVQVWNAGTKEKEIEGLKEAIGYQKSQIAGQEQQIKNSEDKNKTNEQEISDLENKVVSYKNALSYYDENVVIIEPNDKYYHKHSCEKLEGNLSTVCNPRTAEASGYKACPYCCGGGQIVEEDTTAEDTTAENE